VAACAQALGFYFSYSTFVTKCFPDIPGQDVHVQPSVINTCPSYNQS
jgi:hypothetical protein